MSALAELSGDTGSAELLSGLDPEQQRVVLAPVGPVCVLAGAGTGKTRAITRRVAHQVVTGQLPAGQVLTVTFTARAAGELRTRLRQLGADGVQARTFHAAALRQLGYFWPQVMGGPLPQLVSSKARLVAQAARAARVTLQGPALRDVTAEIEWAKATMVGPGEYAAAAARAARDLPLEAAATASIYTAYEEAKRQAGMIDFEDLLLLMAGLIEEHRFVADELRARYRHFVVDEFQDVNPLAAPAADGVARRSRTACAWWAIRSRRSTPSPARPRATCRPSASATSEAEVIRLVRNYRSTPQVVGLANAVIKQAKTAGRPAGAGGRRAGAELADRRGRGARRRSRSPAASPS